MRILFDHCVPKPLKRHLKGHAIRTAYEMGWDRLKNGRLLDAAQVEFDVLLTVDQNIPQQQNLQERSIALVVMMADDNKVETLLPLVPELLLLLPTTQGGQIYSVEKTVASEEE